MVLPNLFPRGVFPEYRLNCTQLSNGTWHCSLVEGCNSFVELGVICKNYEDLYNECSRTSTLSTLSTNMHATTPLPIVQHAPPTLHMLTIPPPSLLSLVYWWLCY